MKWGGLLAVLWSGVYLVTVLCAGFFISYCFRLAYAQERFRDPGKCGRAFVRALEKQREAGGGKTKIPQHCSRMRFPKGYTPIVLPDGSTAIKKDSEDLDDWLGLLANPPKDSWVPVVASEALKDGIVRTADAVEVWEKGRKVGTVTLAEEEER